MSAPQWKPGDVAMVTEEGRDPIVALRTYIGWHSEFGASGRARIVAARPLVVIDPEDRGQVARLVEAICANGPDDYNDLDAMTKALRSLVTPPRPEEPQGLGAVVEDAEGKRWVLAYTGGAPDLIRWRSAGWEGYYRHWDTIPAVRVLSEGWSA